MAENQTVNIYTDSRYGFGIAHDYGPIWKSRDFVGSSGKPIKNAESVARLFRALELPKMVAIVKVQAHTKEQTKEAKGNRRADAAAKQAALLPLAIAGHSVDIVPQAREIDLEILQKLQEQIAKPEREEWEKQGLKKNQEGLYAMNDKLCLPRVLYSMICALSHGPTHQSKEAMVSLVMQGWVAPGFNNVAAKFVQGCMVCACHNIGRTVKVPPRCTPKPLYPFQRLQIDFIQLPRVGTYEYVLVCVDLFSGWPEAWPTAKANAKTVAKKLLSEVVCRFGVPEVIESDRGTHFTSEVLRLNGTLKSKIQKAMAETGKPWTECLPIALYSVRVTPHRKTELSPYEILFGTAPKTGLYFPQQLQALHSDMTQYVGALCKRLQQTHDRVLVPFQIHLRWKERIH